MVLRHDEGDNVPRAYPVVLLVDDHDAIAMYAIGLLAMGFQPVTAENSHIGFERACRIQPDVIVADARLPDGSGVELARRLREDERTREAGIIVLTGDSAVSLKRQAHAAGCDRFIVKPCLPDVLALQILDVLNRRQHPS